MSYPHPPPATSAISSSSLAIQSIPGLLQDPLLSELRAWAADIRVPVDPKFCYQGSDIHDILPSAYGPEIQAVDNFDYAVFMDRDGCTRPGSTRPTSAIPWSWPGIGSSTFPHR